MATHIQEVADKWYRKTLYEISRNFLKGAEIQKEKPVKADDGRTLTKPADPLEELGYGLPSARS